MTEDRTQSLTSSRRRRGVIRGSITRLGTRLNELERNPDDPATFDHAQRLSSKLNSLDAEFKVQHYSVIDLVDNEDELADEQDIIDRHDDNVAELSVRLQKLLSLCSSHSASPSNPRNLHQRKLERLDKELTSLNATIESLDEAVDNTCRLQLHQEQLSKFRREISEIRDSLLILGVDDTDPLMGTHFSREGNLRLLTSHQGVTPCHFQGF